MDGDSERRKIILQSGTKDRLQRLKDVTEGQDEQLFICTKMHVHRQFFR